MAVDKMLTLSVAHPRSREHKESNCSMIFLSLTTLPLWEKENTWVVQLTKVSFPLTRDVYGVLAGKALPLASWKCHSWAPSAPQARVGMGSPGSSEAHTSWDVSFQYVCKTRVRRWDLSPGAGGSHAFRCLAGARHHRACKGVCAPKDTESCADVSKTRGHGDLHPQHASVLNSHWLHWDKDT